jgi:CheY-like chemotaxis protein
VSEPTLIAQTKLVTALEMSRQAPVKSGPERRKRKRGMFSVPLQIRGGLGTLEVFEDLVTSLDVSRDGLLLSTSRGGYSVGQRLHVSCPYWCMPTALNVPRNAQVVRNVLQPNYTYALALQFMPGICEESSWNNSASPFPNQVRVLCVESDATASSALCAILEKDGYHVVAVATAKEARDILSNEAPDVILAEAECQGQEISGKDLCAIVKTCPRLQHIPVILLTSSALPSDYATSHQIGAVVCMTIPCRPERVRCAIHLVAAPPALCSGYSARCNVASFVRTSSLRTPTPISDFFNRKKKNLVPFEARFPKIPSLRS